jgi:hypothetical protein
MGRTGGKTTIALGRALRWGLAPLAGLWLGCNLILGTRLETSEGAGGAAGASSATSAGTGGAASASAASSTAATSSTASTSSSSGSGGGSSCATPCDCDGDGDRSSAAACDHDGGDCNDDDPLVNAKQTMFFTTPGSHGWDYNCDGVDEFEFTTVLQCPDGALGCDNTTEGWHAVVPACGQAGMMGTCAGTVTTGCTEKLMGVQTQRCR